MSFRDELDKRQEVQKKEHQENTKGKEVWSMKDRKATKYDEKHKKVLFARQDLPRWLAENLKKQIMAKSKDTNYCTQDTSDKDKHEETEIISTSNTQDEPRTGLYESAGSIFKRRKEKQAQAEHQEKMEKACKLIRERQQGHTRCGRSKKKRAM